ncbi:MAG: hypothetical protein ABJB66_00480 [Gemmatimonadaceae bacterium]
MSLILPLLLAGALVSSSVAPSASNDDGKPPRAKRAVVVDTAAHRQMAADLVTRAKVAGEMGLLDAARAQLLAANTMLRESGGLEETSAYTLVHIDYALARYSEAAELLNELADQSIKSGNATLAANAVADAAELYGLGNRRPQAAAAVVRLRELIKDSSINDTDRTALRKRLG